jgi:hypothetical protein
VAYKGIYTNPQGTTYTFKEYFTGGATGTGAYFKFGQSGGEDITLATTGMTGEFANKFKTDYAGSVEEFNAFIEKDFIEVDGLRTYLSADPNLVNAPLAGNPPPRDANQSPTPTPIGAGGTSGAGGAAGGFQSILDAINGALGGIQSTSPQNAALNAQAQSLGNASYNIMTQLQGQISTLLGQSQASSTNALNNLTSQMNALGTGKQSLLDTTIARMNQLATPSKRKKIDTEATKVAPTTSLFGL